MIEPAINQAPPSATKLAPIPVFIVVLIICVVIIFVGTALQSNNNPRTNEEESPSLAVMLARKCLTDKMYAALEKGYSEEKAKAVAAIACSNEVDLAYEERVRQ
jgi:hypothetical protein